MNRYQSIEIIKKNGIRYYKNNLYPEIPFSDTDVYVITAQGDRYDLLAQQYYNNVSLWWVIPIANVDLLFDSIFIPEGTQLRIPINIQEVITKYFNLNP